MSKQTKSSGFTFIELLIVTVIISVIIAVAIPRFRASYEQLQLNIDIGNLESFINAARELAVLEERKLMLIYSEEDRAFSLFQETQNNEQTEWLPFDYPLGKPYHLKERINIRISEEKIVFHTDGTIDECVIWLNNSIGQKLGLQINMTGNVLRLES
ncbi:MAG: prepilin-type N-terminal cleavage/methylation domain-containing protein [Chlamydiota bacterium]|nr:prepilin-type N-terminal cleavage/methylation domain-containing protein [Chlamydiota bacterium]